MSRPLHEVSFRPSLRRTLTHATTAHHRRHHLAAGIAKAVAAAAGKEAKIVHYDPAQMGLKKGEGFPFRWVGGGARRQPLVRAAQRRLLLASGVNRPPGRQAGLALLWRSATPDSCRPRAAQPAPPWTARV